MHILNSRHVNSDNNKKVKSTLFFCSQKKSKPKHEELVKPYYHELQIFHSLPTVSKLMINYILKYSTSYHSFSLALSCTTFWGNKILLLNSKVSYRCVNQVEISVSLFNPSFNIWLKKSMV